MFHTADFTPATAALPEMRAARPANVETGAPAPARPCAPRGVAAESESLLRRPRLLARAAREGARMYRRERDLPGALPGATGPRRGTDIVSRLLGIEAQIEADRRAGAAGYSPARHVQVLSALVAESLALAARA